LDSSDIVQQGKSWNREIQEKCNPAREFLSARGSVQLAGFKQIIGNDLVFGKVTRNLRLKSRSHMPENGRTFSDSILDDPIDFHSGLTVTIGLTDWQGKLVV